MQRYIFSEQLKYIRQKIILHEAVHRVSMMRRFSMMPYTNTMLEAVQVGLLFMPYIVYFKLELKRMTCCI